MITEATDSPPPDTPQIKTKKNKHKHEATQPQLTQPQLQGLPTSSFTTSSRIHSQISPENPFTPFSRSASHPPLARPNTDPHEKSNLVWPSLESFSHLSPQEILARFSSNPKKPKPGPKTKRAPRRSATPSIKKTFNRPQQERSSPPPIATQTKRVNQENDPDVGSLTSQPKKKVRSNNYFTPLIPGVSSPSKQVNRLVPVPVQQSRNESPSNIPKHFGRWELSIPTNQEVPIAVLARMHQFLDEAVCAGFAKPIFGDPTPTNTNVNTPHAALFNSKFNSSLSITTLPPISGPQVPDDPHENDVELGHQKDISITNPATQVNTDFVTTNSDSSHPQLPDLGDSQVPIVEEQPIDQTKNLTNKKPSTSKAKPVEPDSSSEDTTESSDEEESKVKKKQPSKQQPSKQQSSKQQPSKQSKLETLKQEPSKQQPSKQSKQETLKQEPSKQQPSKQQPLKQQPVRRTRRSSQLSPTLPSAPFNTKDRQHVSSSDTSSDDDDNDNNNNNTVQKSLPKKHSLKSKKETLKSKKKTSKSKKESSKKVKKESLKLKKKSVKSKVKLAESESSSEDKTESSDEEEANSSMRTRLQKQQKKIKEKTKPKQPEPPAVRQTRKTSQASNLNKSSPTKKSVNPTVADKKRASTKDPKPTSSSDSSSESSSEDDDSDDDDSDDDSSDAPTKFQTPSTASKRSQRPSKVPPPVIPAAKKKSESQVQVKPKNKKSEKQPKSTPKSAKKKKEIKVDVPPTRSDSSSSQEEVEASAPPSGQRPTSPKTNGAKENSDSSSSEEEEKEEKKPKTNAISIPRAPSVQVESDNIMPRARSLEIESKIISDEEDKTEPVLGYRGRAPMTGRRKTLDAFKPMDFSLDSVNTFALPPNPVSEQNKKTVVNESSDDESSSSDDDDSDDDFGGTKGSKQINNGAVAGGLPVHKLAGSHSHSTNLTSSGKKNKKPSIAQIWAKEESKIINSKNKK